MALFDDQVNGTGQETFLQRQRRLQGQQTAMVSEPRPDGAPRTGGVDPRPVPATGGGLPNEGRPPAPQGPAATPVTGNGKIPPPAPTPAPLPALNPFTPSMASTQATSQPAQQASNTGVGTTNQGGPLQAMELGNQPFATYKPSQLQTQITQPGVLPNSYQGSQFSQFQSPEQQQTQQLQTQRMNEMLRNPETLSPQVLAALKEKQKEAALMMEQQGLQSAQQNAASRGFGGNGSLQGIEQAIRGNTSNQILNSNRDLDIAAATQNRQDLINALGASDSVLSGQMGRATQGYGATLAGQGAQAGDTRSVSQDAIARAVQGNDAMLRAQGLNLQKEGMQMDENFRGYTSERGAQDAALQRVLAQFGINEAKHNSDRSDNALSLNAELGRGGLELDNKRLTETGRQFNEGHQLNILQFLENQRQHNNGLGYNYAALGQSGQNSLIAQIMSILGG